MFSRIETLLIYCCGLCLCLPGRPCTSLQSPRPLLNTYTICLYMITICSTVYQLYHNSYLFTLRCICLYVVHGLVTSRAVRLWVQQLLLFNNHDNAINCWVCILEEICKFKSNFHISSNKSTNSHAIVYVLHKLKHKNIMK